MEKIIKYIDKKKIEFIIIIIFLFFVIIYLYISNQKNENELFSTIIMKKNYFEPMDNSIIPYPKINPKPLQFISETNIKPINLSGNLVNLKTQIIDNKGVVGIFYLAIIHSADCTIPDIKDCSRSTIVLIDSTTINSLLAIYNDFYIKNKNKNSCLTKRFLSDFLIQHIDFSSVYKIEGKPRDSPSPNDKNGAVCSQKYYLSANLYVNSIIQEITVTSENLCADVLSGTPALESTLVTFEPVLNTDSNTYYIVFIGTDIPLYIGYSNVKNYEKCYGSSLNFIRTSLYSDKLSPFVLKFNITDS